MTREDLIEQYALAQAGGPYIYGATAKPCNPEYRRARAKQYPEMESGIRKYCPVLSGKQKDCTGCKWQGMLAHDCAQLTKFAAANAGLKLVSGASSQWNKTDWAEKGPIDKAPAGRVLFLYKRSKTGKPMGHTGIRLRDGRTVDARGHKAGTVLSPSLASLGWTDYAILPGQTEDVADMPTNTRPTLRRGDKGDAVRDLQTMLVAQGYDLPGSGIDGDYGPETRGAVLAFQDDRGLKMDGIVGPETWAELESEQEKAEGKPEDNPLDEWEILTDSEKLDNLHERLKRLEGR